MKQNKVKINKKEAIHQLWRYGHLSWKLDANQKQLYELFYKGEEKMNVWLLARRSGKSFCLITLAIESALRKPNSIIKYVAPTKLQLKSYIEPLVRKVCSDAPEDL